jgi:hypothetical protein
MVLAGTAAALLIAGLTGKKHDQSGAAAPGVPSGAEIPLVRAFAFDPYAGDGENDNLRARAIDSDPNSFWPTSTYQTSPVLSESANKPGVGLVVDAGKQVSARTMEVTSTSSGWDAKIYASASSAYPQTLSGWGAAIGGLNGFSTDQTLQLQDLNPSRFYLIWITRLSPQATQSSLGGIGGYNVQIKDVKLFS